MQKKFIQKSPDKHHYIPSFYTKEWISKDDGKLFEFSRPYKDVIDRKRHPDATGYLKGGYALQGFPEETRNFYETNFFAPVDQAASDALLHMQGGHIERIWPARLRDGWSRFIMSLLLRCPEDLTIFRHNFENLWRLTLVKRSLYAAGAEGMDIEKELNMMHIHKSLIDNINVGTLMNSMLWNVVDVSMSDYKLFTSDRPVIMTNGLAYRDGHIVMPIGPHKFFIASTDIGVTAKILRRGLNGLVKDINQRIVTSASKFVYAKDPSRRECEFIKKNFGTKPCKRLMQAIIERTYKNIQIN